MGHIRLLANSLYHGLENSEKKLGEFWEIVKGKKRGNKNLELLQSFSGIERSNISNPRVLSDVGLLIPL